MEGEGLDAVFTFRGEEDPRVLERVGATDGGSDEDSTGAIAEAGVSNGSGPASPDGGGLEAEAQASLDAPPSA